MLPKLPPGQIMDVARSPGDNLVVNAAIRESVQEFPAPSNTGSFYATSSRGPLLPSYGTKWRDQVLRLFYRNEYNLLIQGVISAITKKYVTTPWEIKGDTKKIIHVPSAAGRMISIRAVEHYQLVLQNAQFGAGWEVFASRFLEDFFCQDFGAICELIGPGEPTGPIEGPVMGIAQLDAGRSFITGNPYYPVMYYGLISGSLHRMHASRIVRFVDQPSADERYFGIGLCSLSRAISVSNRQILMSRYIEGRVDDKPQPGIIVTSGMTTDQRKKLIASYEKELQNDALPIFGKTLWFESINIDNPVKVESLPWSQTPEKFDWVLYNSLDVDAIALTFGVDRQELWELAGRGLGSGAQSEILAEKAKGKMFGFLLQNTERFLNRRMLPREFEFAFKYHDQQERKDTAEINLQLSQTASTLSAVPGAISPVELRQFLANGSDQFKDVLATAQGTVELPDSDRRTPGQTGQAVLEDANPIDVSQQEHDQGQRPLSQAVAKELADVTPEEIRAARKALRTIGIEVEDAA